MIKAENKILPLIKLKTINQYKSVATIYLHGAYEAFQNYPGTKIKPYTGREKEAFEQQ